MPNLSPLPIEAMFSFFSSKRTIKAGELLQTDMHSHILPGIDDGAADVEASIALIDGLISLGYKKLIATPHILKDYYPNTPASIRAAQQVLQEELDKRGYTIPIAYAAEYMLDEHFSSLMEEDDLLSFGDRYVLLETMFIGAPANMEEVLAQVSAKSYRPVLAHPERYHYVDKSLSCLLPLKEKGCLFQVNLLSFAGYYGKREQELALRLLEAGFIDFIGSDMHHKRHLDSAQRFALPAKVADQLERIAYKNLSL